MYRCTSLTRSSGGLINRRRSIFLRIITAYGWWMHHRQIRLAVTATILKRQGIIVGVRNGEGEFSKSRRGSRDSTVPFYGGKVPSSKRMQ